MKIIFLDFDGVMDTSYFAHILSKKGMPCSDLYGTVFDPDCIKNLKEIIENTGANIVVTSSWKSLMSFKELLEMWKHRKLPGQIIDTTPNRKRRGDEIDDWLNECDEECQYVIIDDLNESNFSEHQKPRLVIVNPVYGIDKEVSEKAKRILNG